MWRHITCCAISTHFGSPWATVVCTGHLLLNVQPLWSEDLFHGVGDSILACHLKYHHLISSDFTGRFVLNMFQTLFFLFLVFIFLYVLLFFWLHKSRCSARLVKNTSWLMIVPFGFHLNSLQFFLCFRLFPEYAFRWASQHRYITSCGRCLCWQTKTTSVKLKTLILSFSFQWHAHSNWALVLHRWFFVTFQFSFEPSFSIALSCGRHNTVALLLVHAALFDKRRPQSN